ncbi:MAG TPA: carboxypeptidase-like regulatory domain-containing protein, partial [Ignavibacteriaceae bacterium]
MPKLSVRRLLLLLAVLFSSFSLLAQRNIIGKIRDSVGPVVGATISVKGANTATLTGIDGGFSLLMPKGRSILIISSVGYSTKEIKLKDDELSVEVILELSKNSLDEIVITGYTAQKKKDLTGAVAIVKPTDLTKVASPSFAQQIEGRASGVQVTTSGAPGDGASIRI